jgi:AraC-like DNA-binding protein
MLWSQRDFSLHRERERLVVRTRVEARTTSDAPRNQSIDIVLFWLHLVECVAGAPVLPESVRVPGCDCAGLRELVDCSIKASADEIAIYFFAADARRENPAADERLFRVLLAHAEERHLDYVHMQTVSERLHRTLLSLDDSADSRAEALASRLGLGVRTLHRRLRAEGTSYRKVLTNFQMRRCIERLESPSASAKQVAFALGFSDPASFYRAFKRWTGHTVSEYRLLRGSSRSRLLNGDGDSERA